MQTAIFITGLLLVYFAIMMRVQRWEDYQSDLEFAEDEKKEADCWGWDPDEFDERIEEIRKEGYGTRWRRLKFNLGFLALAIPGLLLLLTWHLGNDAEANEWLSVWVAVMVGAVWVHFTIMRPM